MTSSTPNRIDFLSLLFTLLLLLLRHPTSWQRGMMERVGRKWKWWRAEKKEHRNNNKVGGVVVQSPRNYKSFSLDCLLQFPRSMRPEKINVKNRVIALLWALMNAALLRRFFFYDRMNVAMEANLNYVAMIKIWVYLLNDSWYSGDHFVTQLPLPPFYILPVN